MGEATWGCRTAAAWVVVCALMGCGAPDEGGEPLHIECNEACECIDPGACLTPWPSNRYLVEEPERRLDIPEAAMMRNRDGVTVDPGPWNDWDGFSAMPSMVARFDVPIDPSGLPSWQDDAPGLDEASPTVLLDAETGERVAAFAEIDDSAPTILYVRPAARLREGRRYVVAIRRLLDRDGAPILPSDAFRAIRDGIPTDHPQLEARRPVFEADVFAPLAAAGVARDELILAWDFTTGSGARAWGDLVDMAAQAYALAGDEGLGCAITATEARDGFRVIDGTFTVPRFVASDVPGAPLLRDTEGRPAADGTMQADFRAVVPDAVAAGGEPAAVVLYGHGLFDDRTRVSEPGGDGRTPPVEVAQRCGGQVWVATDFLGLTEADLPLAAAALSELSTFDGFFDRVRQGLVNMLLLPRTFAHGCAALPELAGLVAPDEAYYYGNSQGAILGTTLAALSPDIERWALGVGGISYPIMLPRSINSAVINAVLEGAYEDRLERDLAMAMFAQRWDLVEGAAFAPHVLADPLPGLRTRSARVLYQVGRHDVQTANVASEIAARTLGLVQSETAPHRVWGLDTVRGEADSAYVEYDVGVAPVPPGPSAPTLENGVHEAVRRLDEAQSQVCRFLRPDGRVSDL